MGTPIKYKLNVPNCRFKVELTATPVNDILELQYKYNKALTEEIKAMEGSHWCGFDTTPRKIWTVKNTARNRFNLSAMTDEINPFELYDTDLIRLPNKEHYKNFVGPEDERIFDHQIEMAEEILTRHRKIIAGEMGVGKTLATMLALEESKCVGEIVWISMLGPLKAATRDFKYWGILKRFPEMKTFGSLKEYVESWPKGRKSPQFMVIDEGQKVKTPTAQCSTAAAYISESMARDWGGQEFVTLLSGTPSPKNPVDWWNLCEIVCPGFIREGTPQKFKRRLSISKLVDGPNGTYPEFITWLDNEEKCAECGKFREHENHNICEGHVFVKSINEVAKLYKRLSGLVSVYLKKDYLKHLPEKIYKEIRLKPSDSILRVAKSIVRTSPNVITAMTLLRELSDGFQYVDVKDGKEKCGRCNGTRKVKEYTGAYDLGEVDNINPDGLTNEAPFEMVDCDNCNENGEVDKYIRSTKEIPTPKEDAFKELLDTHEESGRFVIYAGFTGSVDRCVKIAQKEGWNVIRVDGRGWIMLDYKNNVIPETDYLEVFQKMQEEYPRVCFVAQAGSGGVGITLTASSGLAYWSNSFNAVDRFQSEDRIHRLGMDTNKGATIYDLIHLDSDEKVLKNLKMKKDLQAMTMGDFAELKKVFGEERET